MAQRISLNRPYGLRHEDDIVRDITELYQKTDDLNKSYINYFDFSSESVTTISDSDTWVKLSATTTQGFSNNGLVHTNNRVTNSGDTRVFQLEGIASISSGNNNQIHLAFFKNDNLWPCSEQEAVMSSGGKMNAIPFHCLIELEFNDYVEVYVKNKNNETDITLQNINVIIKEL